MSASASARSDADFALVESEARAGDAVHFTITGAKGKITYELEIGNVDLVEDAVGFGSVTGEFTLPHLGDSERNLTVEAEIRESRHKTTVKRKLRYLGAALPPREAGPVPEPVIATPAEQPPAAAAPLAAAPAAASAPPAEATAQDAAPVSRKAKRRTSRRAARRHTSQRGARRHTTTRRAGHRSNSRRKSRHKARTRHRPRTAPLFDGVPEGGTTRPQSDYAAPNAILPPAAVPAATRTVADESGGLGAAVLVPGLLGLAALMLTGTVVHRRRRLR